MTRAVWVDAGNDPTYAKYLPRGITVPFFDPRDPRVTAAYLDNVKAHPGITACGIYSAWNWAEAGGDPKVYAHWTDAQLRRIGWQGNAWVCLDIEEPSASYVVAALQEWRKLRPMRPTWWTMEGFQGGLFNAASVAAIVQSGVRLAPSFYAGDMTPLEHSPMLDMLIAGFPGERMDGMYDAAVLPYSWRGFAFTQGRLP